MVSQTVDLTITLTFFISITSSDLGLSSNRHLPLLLNKIESTGKADIKNHKFIVVSLDYTVKLSKTVHMEKYKNQQLLTDTIYSILNSIF